ncbi:unnamed protein product [Linum trigynum]
MIRTPARNFPSPSPADFPHEFAGLRMLTQHFAFYCHCRRRRPAEEFYRLECKIPIKRVVLRTDLVSLCAADRWANNGGGGPAALLSGSKDVAEEEEEKTMAAGEWSCGVCKVVAKTERQWKQHVEGSRHKANVVEAARSVGKEMTMMMMMNPKSVRKQEKKPAAAAAGRRIGSRTAGFEFWCEACEVGTYSLDGMIKHIGGRRHAGGIKELHNAGRRLAGDERVC